MSIESRDRLETTLKKRINNYTYFPYVDRFQLQSSSFDSFRITDYSIFILETRKTVVFEFRLFVNVVYIIYIYTKKAPIVFIWGFVTTTKQLYNF